MTEPMSAHLPMTVASPSMELPPGTFMLDGRFRVVRVLGRGGMGLVYLAEQVSLGRSVAIKVLRHDLPLTPGFTDRFRREALLLSSVEHPAVVRVIDYGEHGDSPCLVMEYVEGETLEDVIVRDGQLSGARGERLLVQLAQGLAAIHSKGIVHRDLKPENVVLTKSADGMEQARVLDFGIARLMNLEGEEGARASVTQAGVVLGTPEYVSPEQALGQKPDPRSDLYSLGVILYRAVSGRLPLLGPTPREFVSQHVHQAPPPLLSVAPHLAPFPVLVDTIMSCLEKDPELRPQTASALYIPTASVSLPPGPRSSAPIPTAKSTRLLLRPMRWPLWAGLGAVIALAVAAAVVWYRLPAPRAHRLVEAGRGSEALQVLDDLGEKAQTWPLRQLKAAALHQVAKHEEEWKLMATAPEGEGLEPMAVQALVDDFGRLETPKLRRLLAQLPKAKALPLLQKLAQQPQSWAQWGALRFVDIEYAGQGLPVLELYIRALEGRNCGMRQVAAQRLVAFRSAEAVAPLEKLKNTPKENDEDCGQAAAEKALKLLPRE